MVFFCSVLGLLGVLTYMFPAFAHQDDPHPNPLNIPLIQTAQDVTADRSNYPILQLFVGHALAHLGDVSTFAEATELVDEFRKMGDWNDGSTYLVLLTGSGGVHAHMDNRELEDEDWSTLVDSQGNMVGEDFLNVQPPLIGGFVDYYNDGDKKSYAIPFTDPLTMQPYILIGGFDLQPEVVDIPYEQLPGADTITPSITAEEVDTREELKTFVKGAIEFFGRALADPEIDLVKARKLFRAEDGPWRHVSTYIWIMDDQGNVIFNGGNRNIEQTNLLGGGQNPTLVEIIERLIAASKETEEDDRFVEYDWDDPAIEGDEAPGGGAGGSSPKLGYVEPFANPSNPNQIFIFGSGLYLGPETPEMETPDDGGCAISGTENTTKSSLLNLFLVMSVLFFAVSFKRRLVLG